MICKDSDILIAKDKEISEPIFEQWNKACTEVGIGEAINI